MYLLTIQERNIDIDIDDQYMNISDRNIDIDDQHMNISDRDVDIMCGNIESIIQS